jgi:tRNA threonylcarbamoyladenosine biosynthesis protein TsaE
VEFSVLSPDETATVAAELAPQLVLGDVVCLRGELGAGKTTFTRALVAALGSPDLVSSPTFTLLHEYHSGKFPIAHLDCYRLENATEFVDAGLQDYLDRGEFLVLIEWPERIEASLPKQRWEVNLIETGPESRVIKIMNCVPAGEHKE